MDAKKRKIKFSVLFSGLNNKFLLPPQRVTVDGRFTSEDLKKLLQIEEEVQFVLQLTKGSELLRGSLEDVCTQRSIEIFVISSPETLQNSVAPISVLRATSDHSVLIGLHNNDGDNLMIYNLDGGGSQLAAGCFESAPILCADWIHLDKEEGLLAAGSSVRGKLGLWQWRRAESRLQKVVELVGHDRQVSSLSISMDENFLVSTGAADGTVKLWSTGVDAKEELLAETGGIPHRRRHPAREVSRRPPRLTFKLPVAADNFQWGALIADWFTAEQLVVAGQDRWLRFYQLTATTAVPEPILKLQLSASHGLAALATRRVHNNTSESNPLLACALNANAGPVLLVDVRAEQAVTHRLRRSAHCALTLRWNPSCAEQLVEMGRDALNLWDIRQSNRAVLHLANDKRSAEDTASVAVDWVDKELLVAAQHDKLWIKDLSSLSVL